MEYPCSNFCVGICVDGHLATNFLHKSKDALEDCASFDTNMVIGGRKGIIVSFEKPFKTYKRSNSDVFNCLFFLNRCMLHTVYNKES